MTTLAPAPRRHPLSTLLQLHRPLVLLSAAMIALVPPTVVLAVVDPTPVTGVNGWLKPLKFELSIALYALTLAWLTSLLRRGRRLAHRLGTGVAVLLAVEAVIIVGAAALGTTSHFNVSTPAHAAAFAVMGVSISATWLLTAAVGVLLWREPTGDRAVDLAVRAGVVVALAGMAVAFLMTSPTAQQLDDFQGVSGAHTVGLADGGPGLPLLGWSTVAGDLRVPHFVGMHALQGLPLAALALGLLARRGAGPAALARPEVRTALVAVLAGAWAVALVLLTWQALVGQPVVHPSGAVLAAGAATAALAVAAAAAAVSGRLSPRVGSPGGR